MAVDIGAEAINRDSTVVAGYTIVLKEHPATVGGTMTSIDIWANANIGNLIVGTFYKTNGDTLKCRDSEAIAGIITAGAKVNKEVTITVEIGDYIGLYWTVGVMERSTSGDGIWLFSGQSIDPDDEETYTPIANFTASLGGYIPGAAVVGRAFGFIIG